MKNFNFNEDAIREAAYYIWKNAGCPANSSLHDWNAAIEQLSLASKTCCNSKNNSCNSTKTSSLKTSSLKTTSLKSASLKKSTSKTSNSKTKSAKKSK